MSPLQDFIMINVYIKGMITENYVVYLKNKKHTFLVESVLTKITNVPFQFFNCKDYLGYASVENFKS